MAQGLFRLAAGEEGKARGERRARPSPPRPGSARQSSQHCIRRWGGEGGIAAEELWVGARCGRGLSPVRHQ